MENLIQISNTGKTITVNGEQIKGNLIPGLLKGKSITFNCSLVNAQEIVSEFLNSSDFKSIKKEHEEFNKARIAKRDLIKNKMEAIISSQENYSALEIWQAARWAAKNQWGFRAADIVLADNELSKTLLKKLGTYTVTPFDDNSLLIKANGKKYGTKRGWGDVEDLLIKTNS